MITEVTHVPSLVHARPCEINTRKREGWSVSIQGERNSFSSHQPLAIVGSADCCHIKLPNLPAVACVLYHCGSEVLYYDLTRSNSSAPGIKIRSSTRLQVLGHELDLEFSPSLLHTNTQAWPQIEFFRRDWSERRQLSTEIATIGSDYPSRYRLRGSSLAACHAVLIWHDASLLLVDLSQTNREPGAAQAQEILLGDVRFCRDVGIRFCGTASAKLLDNQAAPDRPMDLTLRRCQKMERLNADIVQKFAKRSLKSTHFRRMVHLSLLLPVIIMASMYCFQLLRLLISR